MSKFNQYKRKLRWKSSIRKHGADQTQLPGFDEWPEAQNPQDPYLEARHGPWRAVWNGGRLADVYHDESATPVEAINAGNYDWENASPFGGSAWHDGPPSQEGLTQRLREWAEQHGEETTRNVLPYQ